MSDSTAAGRRFEQPGSEPRWLGEPVVTFEGGPSDLSGHIPAFDRRPFALGAAPHPNELALNYGENPYKDVIVRRPLDGETEMPVGVVSKSYKLVQHRVLFNAALDAFQRRQINTDQVRTILRLTRFGGRMALEFRLPDEFDFDPGDGNILKLSFHCFNSVDGSMKLFIAFGWFRFVCNNGVLVGTTKLRHRMVHNEYLELPDLAILLAQGLADADGEKENYRKWLGTAIDKQKLTAWVDGALRKKWKALAAARVFHICTTGNDGKYADAFETAPPSQKRMIDTRWVPGAVAPATNAYSVCQALSWVATQKPDISDQLELTREIPELMHALVK